jgi:hypothetical protein
MPSSQLAAIQKSTIVRSFRLLEQVAPGLGARWAEGLWFRIPPARGRRDRLAPPGRPFQVPVLGGMVAARPGVRARPSTWSTAGADGAVSWTSWSSR